MGKTSALQHGMPFHILTDLGSQATWAQHARQVCSKMPVMDALFGMIDKREIPRGEERTPYAVKPDSITKTQAELFVYILAQLKPNLSMEIGFGDGLLASVMTAAHMYNGLKGGHIPIQNRARQIHSGVGAKLMEDQGLENYQIMEHPTATVLPQIYMQGINDGLLFVYFNHATTFDEQMMEYFYISHLLNEGGVMAVNTAHPARQALVDYIRKERHDFAFRDVAETITLIQVPRMAAMSAHVPEATH